METVAQTPKTSQSTSSAEVSASPAPTDSKKQRSWLLVAVLSVLLIAFFAIATFRNVPQAQASISGIIHYNGLKPVSSMEGNIVIMQKPFDSGETFAIANHNVPLERGAPWDWHDAVAGETYELQAWALVEGQYVAASDVITVTAPATNQQLVFNVTRQDLEQKNIQPTARVRDNQATIQATLDLNGYIPEGSIVRILGKLKDAQNYEVTAPDFPAIDDSILVWESAQAGEFYSFIGVLLDPSGNVIGQSDPIEVVAPSTDNILRVQSTAATPVQNQKAAISGSVQLNGIVEPGSTIIMRQKLPSESTYHDFLTLNAANGVTWIWGAADAGVQYNITAVYVVNGTERAAGNVLDVTAPASGEVIVINTGLASTPDPSPTLNPTPPLPANSSPSPTPDSSPDSSPSPTPAVTPTASPSPSTTPKPLPSPTPSRPPSPSPSPSPTSLPSPTPLPSPSPTPTPTPPAATCSVNYSIPDEWPDGFRAEVTIRNDQSSSINGWSLTWNFPGNQQITNIWNAKHTQSGSAVTVTNESYNASISGNGGTVGFGFNGSYAGENAKPGNFSLNGTGCTTH